MPDPLYRDPERKRWRKEFGRPVGDSAHLGLWYDRFFDRYDTDWTVEESTSKAAWIATVAGRHGDADELRRRADRQRRLVEALGGVSLRVETSWHFVTGLGLPHPVENGFSWHPTLGLPYLPASSIKGLCRAWIEVWDGTKSLDREARALEWFGGTEQAGDWILFDALPAAPVTLAVDVMTPHRGQWYAEGGSIRDVDKEPEKVPADWHSPIPVPFLVVKEGTFLLSVAPRTRRTVFRRDRALETFLATLETALRDLGAGAKTASGYGRMKVCTEDGPT